MAGYRPPYLWTEERDIIHYLIDNNALHRTRSDALWKEMAASGRFRRTWQSLKQHFRKKIIFNLSQANYGLSAEDAADVKRAHDDTARKNRLTTYSFDSGVEKASSSTHKITQNNDGTESSSKMTQKKVDNSTGKKKLKDLNDKETPNFLEIDSDSDEHTPENNKTRCEDEEQLLRVLTELSYNSDHAPSPQGSESAEDVYDRHFSVPFGDSVPRVSNSANSSGFTKSSSKNKSDQVQHKVKLHQLEMENQQNRNKKQEDKLQKQPTSTREKATQESFDLDTSSLFGELKICNEKLVEYEKRFAEYEKKYSEINLSHQKLTKRNVDLIKENADLKIQMDYLHLKVNRYKSMYEHLANITLNETPKPN